MQAVAVQPDGKVVVGGDFMLPHQNLARFQPASIFGVELDPSFYPDASDTVHALALQPDGRILVGGRFTSLGRSEIWMDRVHIGRLNPDGSIDSFNPGANGNVLSVALQADGKILVGGTFIGLGGGYGTTPRSRLGRFMPDGSVDGWDPGANDQVYALAIETDGKVLIGGIFTKLGGGGSGSSTRTSVGRLTSGSPAMESLSVTGGNVVTWARSGAEPEVSSVTFESSSDGLTYTTLGTGAHVPGGWELVVPNLPTNQNVFIRARGSQVNGAYFGGSTSTHESVSLFYLLDPTTLSGNAGEAVEGLVRDR